MKIRRILLLIALIAVLSSVQMSAISFASTQSPARALVWSQKASTHARASPDEEIQSTTTAYCYHSAVIADKCQGWDDKFTNPPGYFYETPSTYQNPDPNCPQPCVDNDVSLQWVDPITYQSQDYAYQSGGIMACAPYLGWECTSEASLPVQGTTFQYGQWYSYDNTPQVGAPTGTEIIIYAYFYYQSAQNPSNTIVVDFDIYLNSGYVCC